MPTRNFLIRAGYSFVVLGSVAVSAMIVFLLQSKIHIFNQINVQAPTEEVIQFPVSVDKYAKTITENPTVDTFLSGSIANKSNSSDNWWNQVAAVFSTNGWYQNLASPVSRIIVIWPGERKEEVTKNIGDILGWNKDERLEFQSLIDTTFPIMLEGKYFPDQYVTHKKATPDDINLLIQESFQKEILSRYTPEVERSIPLEEALIIASLLEREASDFNNMREVSGVIWNRLFIDMPLQLDATLQYVRGSNNYEPKWWPIVKPRDKFINSPFNTYQNKGLPPAPIASPSAEAILAALNPIVTDCIFYFHTSDRGYHCSENYEEHVRKLRSIYGQGS
jgi:cell division protein YceG involved in septum cleavage